jgi:hypothetical protein
MLKTGYTVETDIISNNCVEDRVEMDIISFSQLKSTMFNEYKFTFI